MVFYNNNDNNININNNENDNNNSNNNNNNVGFCKDTEKSVGDVKKWQDFEWLPCCCLTPVYMYVALVFEAVSELEITVGHRTLSDQILNMSGQFHILIGHDVRTFHLHN